MFLKRQQILDAQDLGYETVAVPEWGGEVCVKMMTGTERDRFEASNVKKDKKGNRVPDLENLRSKLLVKVLVDPDDNYLPMFTEVDIAALGKKSAKALERVADAATKLNGMQGVTEDDLAGEAEGFDSDPSESSTSE